MTAKSRLILLVSGATWLLISAAPAWAQQEAQAQKANCRTSRKYGCRAKTCNCGDFVCPPRGQRPCHGMAPCECLVDRKGSDACHTIQPWSECTCSPGETGTIYTDFCVCGAECGGNGTNQCQCEMPNCKACPHGTTLEYSRWCSCSPSATVYSDGEVHTYPPPPPLPQKVVVDTFPYNCGAEKRLGSKRIEGCCPKTKCQNPCTCKCGMTNCPTRWGAGGGEFYYCAYDRLGDEYRCTGGHFQHCCHGCGHSDNTAYGCRETGAENCTTHCGSSLSVCTTTLMCTCGLLCGECGFPPQNCQRCSTFATTATCGKQGNIKCKDWQL